MPSSKFGDLFFTDRANALLLFPELQKLAFPLQVVHHLNAKTFLKIQLPCWIKRVGFNFYLNMPLNRETGGSQQYQFFSVILTKENPVVSTNGFNIFLLTPGVRLPWFSVTLRTARVFALKEWVSSRCKDLTLFHLPS